MKRKILLFSMLLISVLFVGIGKVKAEDYKVGDLVEIINPNGGKSMEFYIQNIDKNNNTNYILISKNPILSNISTIDNEDILEYEYLNNLEVMGSFSPNVCSFKLTQEQINDIDENGIKITCPDYITSYDNILDSVYQVPTDSNYYALYLEKINNNEYLLKKQIAPSKEDLDTKIGKKLNIFISISLNDPTLLKKIDVSELENIDNIQTTTVNDNQNTIANPKTSDINIVIIGMVTLIVLSGVIVGIRRLKKLSK